MSNVKLGFAWVLTTLIATAPLCAFAETTPTVDSDIRAAIAGPQRTASFKLRDKYRHPLETLDFFGIRSDMTVIEVLPGAGWYTEILAPLLRTHGHLVEATPPTTSPSVFFRRMADRYEKKLSDDPDVYGRVTMTPFEPPGYMPLGGEDYADMVVTFLNLHDFVYFNVHNETTNAVMQRFFRSAYQALKPGGVLGIVAQRAKNGESVADAAVKGRVPQSYAIREAEQAGFKLAGTSEINANPKDNGRYPIWYLPPTLKLGDQDHEKFLAIGESDNMTLRFVKPKD